MKINPIQAIIGINKHKGNKTRFKEKIKKDKGFTKVLKKEMEKLYA